MSSKTTAARRQGSVSAGTRERGGRVPARAKSGTGGRPLPELSGVQQRLDPKHGPAAWHELVNLTAVAAADRVASVPKEKRPAMLASVRKQLAGTGKTAITSGEMLATLRRAGVFGELRESESRAVRDEPRPAVEKSIPAANRAALERAFGRAEANKVEILKQPDMLRGEEMAERLGVSRATVDNQRVARRLLALELGTKRGVRYPAWQCALVADPVVRAAFESVLAALASAGPWSRYRFFVQASPALGGRTPVEALQAGESERVRRAADRWAAGEQGGH